MKKLLLIFFVALIQQSFAQTELTEKDAYAYFMKAYNHKPLDKTGNRSVNFGQYRWFDLYLLKFHDYEYNQVKNDEFKIQKFSNKIGKELEQKISEVNHNKIFTQTIKASVGKYDFSKGSFPINYDMENFRGVSGNLQGFRIRIGNIINDESIIPELKMSSSDAEEFINNRKQNNGSVDRKIYLKFYFKILGINTLVKSPQGGVNGYNKEDLTIEVTKIEVLNNEYSTNIIQNITINPNNNSLKTKLVGKWQDTKNNYQTQYNNDNSFYVKNEKGGTYRIVNNIIIRKTINNNEYSYKLKIVDNELQVSGLNKYNEWVHYWTHKKIN